MSTLQRYTRFERARLIGARALQLSEGAPPLIDTEETDPLQVARQELKQDILPISIRRRSAGY